MDIQIVRAELTSDEKYIIVYRDITDNDGVLWRDVPERFPKETLAIRAAEYGMEIDDPRVLDQILLESFSQSQPTDPPDPLFTMGRVSDALEVVQSQIEQVRIDNGAPKEPAMRSLFHAAELDESTAGLTQAKRLFMEHANLGTDFVFFVQHRRDAIREQMQKGNDAKNSSLSETLKSQVLGSIQAEAILEENERRSAQELEKRLSGAQGEQPDLKLLQSTDEDRIGRVG